jgi:monolysocardiolipin acyltransferase
LSLSSEHPASTFACKCNLYRYTQGLITVSNHASTFDDPGVLSYLIPFRYFFTEPSHGGVRWTMCTKEICASNPMIHQFFTAGKTVPITRGGGINQAVMTTMAAGLDAIPLFTTSKHGSIDDTRYGGPCNQSDTPGEWQPYLAERVSKGDWLHIFPEGRVSKDGELGRLKWGLGKMLCDVEAMGGTPPVVLPFWHSGMEQVKPYGLMMFYPFKHVHVTVGEPIDFSDLVGRCQKCRNDTQREDLFRSMVARVEESMRETRVRNLKEREVL